MVEVVFSLSLVNQSLNSLYAIPLDLAVDLFESGAIFFEAF